MSLHSIVGLMNSGKTLVLSWSGLREFARGRTIYSNYYLSYPHIRINKDYIFQLAEDQPSMENSCFLLDELWIWLDCRSAMQNKVATYFFLQSSKDDTPIYFTAQTNNQNEYRIRQNMHKLSNCSRVIIKNDKVYKLNSEKRFLDKSLIPFLYIEQINFEQRTVGLSTNLVPVSKTYLKADKLFKLFNTKQKIKYNE